MGTVVTFYSYKGGTGRSMSLANVAWILASNGSRVLIVDWDLEAPGLHRYFHPFLPDDALRSSPGVIDMMWEFAQAALDTTSSDAPDWHVEYARTSPYAVSVKHEFRNGGTIDLMPAGRQDDSYSALVSTFDWDNFYDRLGGGGFLEALRSDMRERYDYVLVDSRTGLSDTAGVCTVALPDVVVTCFSMSTQSIDGAAAVARSISHQRPDDLRILPVPMRVENGEHDKLETSRDYARHAFDAFLWHVDDLDRYWGQVEVPYRSYYAYEEILATIGDRPQQENTILAATERLVDHLTCGQVTSLVAVESEHKRRELLRLFLRGKVSEPPQRRERPDFKVFLTSGGDRPSAHVLLLRLRELGFDAEHDPDLRRWLKTERAKLVVLGAAGDGEPDSDTRIDWDAGTVIRVRSETLDDSAADDLADQLIRPAPVRVPPLSVGEWAWGQDAVTILRILVTEDLTLRLSDMEAQQRTPLPVQWAADGLSSSVQTLPDVFLTTPSKKLIILGAPGSGKSFATLLLIRSLLVRKDRPIPILMPPGTWRPMAEYFDDWVVRSIAENYPSLRASKNLEADVTRLVRLGAVVPVIDGYGEFQSPGEYKQALQQISDTTLPVIVTCTAHEYRSTMAGLRPNHASVIELLPVKFADALNYLAGNTARSRHHTEEALDQLSRRPDSALARTLSSPAMITLTSGYLDNPRADLTDLTAMSVPAQVEEALLDNYVSEAFGQRAKRPGEPNYSTRRTRGWFAFIAARSNASFRWWELHKTMPPILDFLFAWALGLSLCIPAGLGILIGLNGPKPPLWLLISLIGLITVAAAVPAPDIPLSSTLKYLSPTARRHRQMPDDRTVRPPEAVRNGALLTIAGGAAAGTALLFLWAATFGPFSDHSSTTSAYPLAVALTGMWFGGSVGLAVAMTTTWWRYLTTRLLLACYRELPWRLNRFLEDATRRGILRRVGGVYEFRDRRLAEVLAMHYRSG